MLTDRVDLSVGCIQMSLKQLLACCGQHLKVLVHETAILSVCDKYKQMRVIFHASNLNCKTCLRDMTICLRGTISSQNGIMGHIRPNNDHEVFAVQRQLTPPTYLNDTKSLIRTDAQNFENFDKDQIQAYTYN